MFQKIILDKKKINDFDTSSELEWIETNGLGGYASSTVSGANTRRYHALLVASKGQLQRTVLLSKLEEKLSIDEKTYELGCNQYPGIIHPSGYQLLKSFCINPFPTYRYSVDDVIIEKEIFAVYEANRTVITYRIVSVPATIELEIRPMICARDFHHLQQNDQNFNVQVYPVLNGIMMMPYNRDSRIYLTAKNSEFKKEGYWYRDFEYKQERQRGLDFREDLFSPGYFTVRLCEGEEFSVVASTDYPDDFEHKLARKKGIDRRREIVDNSFIAEKVEKLKDFFSDDFINSLLLASDSFLLKKDSDSYGLIAGYHWFSEWGRDTMISLPGLALATGRFKEAANIIKTWLNYLNSGLIPNVASENIENSIYNSVDAGLWLFNAVYLYLKYTENLELIKEIYPELKKSVECYTEGTKYNIHVDSGDGLLVQGEPGIQLTWMDAKVGDWVVTPRHGKAVEINGLWYNALRIMNEFAKVLNKNKDCSKYRNMAVKVKQQFMDTFWNSEKNCLFDCINEERVDDSVRPNQVIPLSLPFNPVPKEQARAVLEVVESELLTPYGLRTLSPRDSDYRGVYQGDQVSRDGAYHQGTVWAWLLGPFISAYAKYHKDSCDCSEKILSFLEAFPQHILEAGLGTISEIFDGNEPHHPRGCISQAWSVAEILRVLLEELVE